jgi:hypothetical protein
LSGTKMDKRIIQMAAYGKHKRDVGKKWKR